MESVGLHQIQMQDNERKQQSLKIHRTKNENEHVLSDVTSFHHPSLCEHLADKRDNQLPLGLCQCLPVANHHTFNSLHLSKSWNLPWNRRWSLNWKVISVLTITDTGSREGQYTRQSSRSERGWKRTVPSMSGNYRVHLKGQRSTSVKSSRHFIYTSHCSTQILNNSNISSTPPLSTAFPLTVPWQQTSI